MAAALPAPRGLGRILADTFRIFGRGFFQFLGLTLLVIVPSSCAQLLSAAQYLDAPLDCIEPRLLGEYADGLGHHWQDPHALLAQGHEHAR